MNNNKQQVRIYQSEDGQLELKVAFDHETVWLTQVQIAELFGTQRPVITKHLSNIFKVAENESFEPFVSQQKTRGVPDHSGICGEV